MLTYALDEAVDGSARSIEVSLHVDGSVSVVDDGRGTDTRRDADGTWVVKPVMATPDLRFFGVPESPTARAVTQRRIRAADRSLSHRPCRGGRVYGR